MLSRSNPLISIILLAYNHENLIVEAIESLFSQTYCSLEIILSDDNSTDNTFAIMEDMANKYDGPHQIILNRNEVNLGVCAHINRILLLTQGELVFCAAGDDVSLPERCAKVVAVWLEHNKKVDLISTDAFDMGFNGEILGVKKTDKLSDWHCIEDWFSHRPYVFGASHVWSRNLINRFGMINSSLTTEDQVMTFRAILTGSAINISEPLVKWRRGGVSRNMKSISVYKKRKEIIAGNVGSIELTQQCIVDANVLSLEDVVKLGFKHKIEQDQVIFNLFSSNSIIEKLNIALYSQQPAFPKRIRFLIYAAFPWLMTPYFFLKKLNDFNEPDNFQ